MAGNRDPLPVPGEPSGPDPNAPGYEVWEVEHKRWTYDWAAVQAALEAGDEWAQVLIDGPGAKEYARWTEAMAKTEARRAAARAARTAAEQFKVEMYETIPWLKKVPGLGSDITNWIIDGKTAYEIVQLVRQSPEYGMRFPGMFDESGQLRYTDEVSYLNDERRYRRILRNMGAADYDYNDPSDFVAFMAQGITPEELSKRVELYDAVRTAGQDVIDAWYVYTGQRLSNDDLYEMIVNPDRRAIAEKDYIAMSSIDPVDFTTWLDRVTEISMGRVVGLMQEMADAGLLSQDAVARVQGASFDQAKRLVARIYLNKMEKAASVGGRPGERAQDVVDQFDALIGIMSAGAEEVDGFLGISEISHAFRLAMIGSAAERHGFALPDEERVEELVTAGLTRARALSGYSLLARRGSEWEAFASRANIELTQEQMENAVLLEESTGLQSALAREAALGEENTGFRFDTNRQGRLVQRGFNRR